MNNLLAWLGRHLAHWLSKERHQHTASPHTHIDTLLAYLKPGDVLLVDGGSRASTAIKYLTQSTWSHAALFVGHGLPTLPKEHCFIEADIVQGVRSIGIEAFAHQHCRICRPMGLTPVDSQQLLQFMASKVGAQYDLRNIIDLARYLMPVPPIPTGFRRKLLQLGSGDPTRAICSTLIAQAFQSISYPILPEVEHLHVNSCPDCSKEVLHIRHYSLFVPRDFDVSPYFQIVKPGLDSLDFHALIWSPERTGTDS